MPLSARAPILPSSSSSLELDPLLRDLVEKKLSLKRHVTSMAAELKDTRARLASLEQLLDQEVEARKVAELKARNLEDEVSKLQKCLEDKDVQLRASLCSTEQFHKNLDVLRSQLSVTQATAESTAASAKSTQLHCSYFLGKLNDMDNLMGESEIPVNNVAEQRNHLPGSRDLSRGQFKDYYSLMRTLSDITDAFAKAVFDNVNEILNILYDVPSKNSENTNQDLIFDDDGVAVAKLREGIKVLSVHWENKSKELESKLDKHRRAVQELKRRLLKLEFCIQEPRPLLGLRERRSKATTLKEIRNQMALEVAKPSGRGSGDRRNLWESSTIKLIASMSMVVLLTLAKR